MRLNPNYAVPKPSDNLISQLPSDRGMYEQLDISIFSSSASNLSTVIGTVWTHAKEKEAFGLSEEQLLLASPIIYGFSLADKFWRTFVLSILMGNPLTVSQSSSTCSTSHP